MKLILTDNTEIEFIEWHDLNCVITTNAVGEVAKDKLEDASLLTELRVDLGDDGTLTFYNVVLDDYTIHDDGYHFHMHIMSPLEKEVKEQKKLIEQQKETIKDLERKVYGNVTFVFNMAAGSSKPTNIYQATTSPLTQDATEPVLEFDFGTSKSDSYEFVFPFVDCPKEFYITKANGNYSLYNEGSYIDVFMDESIDTYVFNDVDCKNT